MMQLIILLVQMSVKLMQQLPICDKGEGRGGILGEDNLSGERCHPSSWSKVVIMIVLIGVDAVKKHVSPENEFDSIVGSVNQCRT